MERPKAYYNIDGVGELGVGFMCLGYALLIWLQLHAAADSAWRGMHAFFIYLAVMLSVIHYGSKAIKNRITYPRTGFVSYDRRSQYWLPMAVGVGTSSLLAAVLIFAGRHAANVAPLSLAGLVFAAAYLRIARTVRWKWAVFGAMLGGAVVIAALPIDLLEALANHTGSGTVIPPSLVGAFWLSILLYGGLLTLSGGISFWLYLRHTKAPVMASE